MTRQEAEFVIKMMSDLFAGKKSVSVFARSGRPPEVRTDQEIDHAYIVEYADKTCAVGVSDSYGVMTGSSEWQIDPDKRSIHARAINGHGEELWFTWRLQNNSSGTWEAFRQAQVDLMKARHQKGA